MDALDKQISKVKKSFTAQLGRRLSGADAHHFELLLDSYRNYYAAKGEIAKNGIVIQSNQRAFVNPAVNVMNEAHKQIVKLCRQFNLSPAADSDGDSEMARIIADCRGEDNE